MATKARPAPIRPAINSLIPSDQAPGNRTDYTVGDLIVDQMRQGVDPMNAAGVAGVTSTEFQAWVREGTMVLARLNAGAAWDKEFTTEQQECAWFADRVVRARATHISTLSALAESAARGTLKPRRTLRTKRQRDDNGALIVVEENETVEDAQPDLTMLAWKLERLEPGVYGNRGTLNITVVDLTDTEDVVDAVEARMRAIAERLGSVPIETTAKELPSG